MCSRTSCFVSDSLCSQSYYTDMVAKAKPAVLASRRAASFMMPPTAVCGVFVFLLDCVSEGAW